MITPRNMSILIRQQFDKNDEMIDSFFENENIALTADELITKRSQYAERDLFLKHMTELTASAYGEVVMNSTIHSSFKNVPSSTRAIQKMRKHLLPFPSGYVGPSPGTGALDNFAKEILDSINARINVNLKRPLINNYSGSGTDSRVPLESFTLNFEEIKVNFQKMLQLVSTATTTTAIDAGIDEMLATASPQETVLMTLLLPAVQKVRMGEHYDDLMNLYFDMTPTERSTWDRDVRLAAFLCAYDFIISHEYDPEDEYTTSLAVNKQICHGVSVMAWARVSSTGQ